MRHAVGQYWDLRKSLLLIAAMLWAFPGSLQASILMPEEVPLYIDQLIADAEAIEGASSSSAPVPADSRVLQPASNDRDDSNNPNEAIFVPSQMSTSPIPTGGSTSGTSTTSTSGVSAFPIDSVTAASISDAELIAWVGGEQRFTLPMPPGNDLLRPPQQIS